MDRLPRSEVARRAGVPEPFVERLVELRILHPDPEGRLSGGTSTGPA